MRTPHEKRKTIPHNDARRHPRKDGLRPQKMHKDGAFLNVHLVLHILALWLARLLLLLSHNLDVDPVDAHAQLGLVHGLALLLAAVVSWAHASTVDASRNGDAVHLEGLVVVDDDEEAVEAVGECKRDVRDDLEVGMAGGELDGGAVANFLLAGWDGHRARVWKVERRVRVQCYLRYQSLIYTYCWR